VRLGAIGDVVNALSVAGAIRAQSPATRIGWVVHPLARTLVEDNPAVDRVHLWDRAGGLRELTRVLRELRAEDYGLAVDLQRIAKSAVVARFSGAERVLGFDRARSKELSWLLTKERSRPGRMDDHVVEQYRDVVRALGLDPALSPHPLPLDVEAEDWAAGAVERFGGAPILLNVGASKRPNRWPAARFAQLARALQRAGRTPLVLTGGPGDRTLTEALGAVDPEAGIHDAVGSTTLRELAALARRSRLMVSADTGPMHLAAAVGCPVVALFGPANPARTGPFGDGHTVVRADARGGRRAMGTLAVPPVLDAVLTTLDARPRG